MLDDIDDGLSVDRVGAMSRGDRRDSDPNEDEPSGARGRSSAQDVPLLGGPALRSAPRSVRTEAACARALLDALEKVFLEEDEAPAQRSVIVQVAEQLERLATALNRWEPVQVEAKVGARRMTSRSAQLSASGVDSGQVGRTAGEEISERHGTILDLIVDGVSLLGGIGRVKTARGE